MIDLNNFARLLKDHNIEFLSGVPDTLLNDFCLYVEEKWPQEKHVLAANEGNAIALASGYHLVTDTIPLVYMQNSGIGNAINPLISLTHQSVYGIPMILLIGWRGEPGVKDHPQHTKQGQLTPILMDDLDIPWKKLSHNFEDVQGSIQWAVAKARSIGGPVALLVPKGVLERGEKSGFEDRTDLMSREEAIHSIVETLPSDTIYVAATGRATRELYEVRRLRGEGHENDFLNVGAMGHTSSIAAGIALGQKQRLVVCLDGDASAIMHMGAMAVIGQSKGLESLIHIVLNNGVHESVGGQNAVTGKINVNEIAKDMGYSCVKEVIANKKTLIDHLEHLSNNREKAAFLEIKIRKGMRKDLPPLVIVPQEQKEKLKYSFFN
ncbi:phosphonopyruvate decarboxylase [Pararhodonellum marinum]|uniref:phosphonopyruvate decarboxylase n=1 Tax=Pararhodonellum marinum TaxID=2755358 RepID=UPI00188E3552|nr:phosphonopyruvate decarboxylase [Pararhodonellum marinum]